MEAVVCKGGKGICTWRQAVVGRQARSFHLEVAWTKARQLGDAAGCREGWEGWAGGFGSGTGASTRVTCGYICSPPTHTHTLLWGLIGSSCLGHWRVKLRASAGNLDSSREWWGGEKSKERNSSKDHSPQEALVSPSLGVPSGPASINQVSWEAVKMEKLKFALPDSTETVFNISMDGQSQRIVPSCGQDT